MQLHFELYVVDKNGLWSGGLVCVVSIDNEGQRNDLKITNGIP